MIKKRYFSIFFILILLLFENYFSGKSTLHKRTGNFFIEAAEEHHED